MNKHALLLALIIHVTFILSAQTSIKTFEAAREYLDNGTNQSTDRSSTFFNFNSKKSKPVELRNGNEVTMSGNHTFTPPFTQMQLQNEILINSAGGQYLDGQSRTWLSDTYFSGGKASTKTFDVTGTTDDALYLSFRYASSGAPFSYNIPYAEGTYTIKLHFLEPYFGAPGGVKGKVGGRVFHVAIEGQQVLSNYDIYAQDGAGKAVVKTFNGVSVADGMLNLHFTSVVDNAIISAIEINATSTNDQVAPTVISITRQSSEPQNTTANSVGYWVTFSESVTGVDINDFTLTKEETADGTIASMSGSGSFYTVTVNAITGTGSLRLDVISMGTGIQDAAGNALSGGYTSGETYNVSPPSTNQYSLQVTIAGSGTVTKNPDQATYATGTAVTLTAAPATGYQFSGWSDDASGTTNPLSITMNSNKTITATFTSVQQQAIKLINSGGAQYVDRQSSTWSADAFFSGGGASSKSFDVAGTTDDALYLSFRKASSSGSFSYNIPVESGTYTIRLHFLEPYFGAPGGVKGKVGGRVFHVDVEGQRVLANYDIYAQDGAGKAVVKTFNGVSVTDGMLNLHFTSVVDNAVVSAIEAEKTTSSNNSYTLIVNTTGSGTVTKNPDQATYASGSTVTLTATPSTGYQFSGWSGDASGTTNPLSFTMSSNKTITGNFTTASTDPSLTRGPYLQMVSKTAMTLRWRTDVATDSKVEVGTSYGTYNQAATNENVTTEHEVRISGLNPGTKYFYRFGSSSKILQVGSDNYFVTAPPASTNQKIRVAAFGDCGNLSTVQTNVLKAYLNFAGGTPAELMLLLGDNAYVDGTDAEFQTKFFNPYGSTILKNHALFPTPGNHDYHTTTRTARDAPYYKNFSMPTAAECGGSASGTEAFYSFDWGNIHFISLDSYGEEMPNNTRLYDTLGPQVTWVKKDLEANTSKWTIVYWHHPPFSKGSHNSDTEGELNRIRQNFIRILERYGVDLVLCGHSHNYERSYLLKGYYGLESSFNLNTHTASNSSAKYDGSNNSCPYTITGGKTHHGTVYVVSGSAARSGSTVDASFPHDALPFATIDGGMFYFEVEDNRLDAKFIRQDGVVYDKFTIMKEVNKTSNLTVTPGESVTLSASWIGTYRWSTGATTRSITVNPSTDERYTVTDNVNCLQDVFNITTITTLPGAKSGITSFSMDPSSAGIVVFPTLVKRGQLITLRINSNEMVEAVLLDANGRLVRSFKFAGTTYIQTNQQAAGTYFIVLNHKNKMSKHKLVITE